MGSILTRMVQFAESRQAVVGDGINMYPRSHDRKFTSSVLFCRPTVQTHPLKWVAPQGYSRKLLSDTLPTSDACRKRLLPVSSSFFHSAQIIAIKLLMGYR